MQKSNNTITALAKDVLYGLCGARASLSQKATVLMYHAVGDNPAFFTVPTRKFVWQMRMVQKKGLRVIQLSELIQKLKAKEDVSYCISITFDDGYKDFYTEAFPILKQYNIPATVFLATDFIGAFMTNSEGIALPMLEKKDIQDMLESGLVEYMPHGAHHCVFSKHSPAEIRDDVMRSCETLEELGVAPKKTTIFAYPKGKITPWAKSLLEEMGFVGAVSVERGDMHCGDDIFSLHRNAIDSATTRTQFLAILRGASDRVERVLKWRVTLVRVGHFCRDLLRGKTIYRALFHMQIEKHMGHIAGSVLDIASGARPSYRTLISHNTSLTTCDVLSGEGVDAVLDFNKPLPFADASYDYVLFFNAYYILKDRDAFLREVYRVLRPHGEVFLASPFLGGEMAGPDDFFRVTKQGLEQDFLKNGFTVSSIERFGERWTSVVYLLHPFFLFGFIRFVFATIAYMLDFLTPKKIRTLHPTPLGYFCVLKK